MKAWAKIALLVAFAGAAALWLAPAPPAGAVRVGRAAPPVELPALAGAPVTLAGLRGRAVALNFWATWCQPCKEELPALAAAWRGSRGSCVEYLGVTEESTREDAAAELARHGVAYPVVMDADGEVARAYGVNGIPSTFLIDAGGTVRRIFTGRISREEVEAALAPLVPGSCPRDG